MVEFSEKEKEVRDFENEIKKQHKNIDMRALKVDRLNRKLATLNEAGGDENQGPMKANVANLERQKHEAEEKIVHVQKQWITNQTEFIKKQNDHMALSDDCKELITSKTILEQKKLRLNNEVDSQEKEIRTLEVAKKNLDFEMEKLNDLLHKNKHERDKLKKQNVNTQQEFK
jgi:chromosome segregation ATPase